METGPCIIYTDMEPAYARGDAIVQNSPQWTNCSDFGVTTRGNLRPVSYVPNLCVIIIPLASFFWLAIAVLPCNCPLV